MLLTLSCTLPAKATAGELENQIIDKAIKAYGGERFLQLQYMTLTDTMNQYSTVLSGSAEQGLESMSFSQHQIELKIDLLNKRKAFNQATFRLVGNHGTDVPTVMHRIFADGKGYVVDHALQQFYQSQRINYENADLGTSLLIDTLLVKQLDRDRNLSQWIDTAFIQGQPHDVLKVYNKEVLETTSLDSEIVIEPVKTHKYTVYVNQTNGYLTRLVKERGGQLISYDFVQHQQTQGITWAKQLLVASAKQTVYHTDSRQISFSPSVDESEKSQIFQLPTDYKASPNKQYLDVSQLTIRQLAKDVYFVGQDWGYTLFIDIGSYYISVGAWQMERGDQAWQKAFDLLKSTTGKNNPVRKHIVTHHHNDHMMGLQQILDQGASLIVHSSDVASVQQHLTEKLPNKRIERVSSSLTTLENEKIILFDVPNSHASHNLVIYLPHAKLLFTEDMFGSSFQTAFHSPANWPDIDTYHRLEVLNAKIHMLELDVEQYVSSHHFRVLSQTEIEAALSIPRPDREVLLNRLFPSMP